MHKRVYLHIGRPKTGTTAIQRTLEENRALLVSLGFTYPGDTRNHNPIVPAVSAGERPLIDEIGDHTIISAEGLMLVDPTIVRRWLDGFDVTVICYVRDQAEAMASAYQQEVKANLVTADFATFAARYGVIDYVPFLRGWADAFGRENLIVHSYDGADVVPDFLSILGLDANNFQRRKEDANPSIAGALLATKRRVNAIWPGSAESLRKLSYRALRILANANRRWRGVQLDPADADRIRKAHSACNAVLEREFLVQLSGIPKT